MKYLFVGLLAVSGVLGSGQSHSAEGLVCTAVIRADLVGGPVVPLHNGTRFNCGPTIQAKTIPEISAAGWMILHVQLASIATNTDAAWQMVIQR